MKITEMKKENEQELHKGWRWVKLGEVCETSSGGTPPRGNKHYYHGNIPWIKSGELKDGVILNVEETISHEGLERSSAKLFSSGTLLIAMYGANVGKLGITGVEAATNQAVCAILQGPNVDRDFLFFWLLKSREAIINSSFGGAQPNISQAFVQSLAIPLPPLSEQKRISTILNAQMEQVKRAREAAEEQTVSAEIFPFSLVSASIKKGRTRRKVLGDCLDEVRNGIGPDWAKYPVLGATRQGLAPAKDPVGKHPERYKPVMRGTIFYNPMRILLGSVAMVDAADAPGVTSPDYVVLKGKDGILDTRWFYYWFRSPDGAHLIESLSRGAVRERILFNRLQEGVIELPAIEVQREASLKMAGVALLRAKINEQLREIEALPTTLLRQAFAGAL